jgi:hypothetical protein
MRTFDRDEAASTGGRSSPQGSGSAAPAASAADTSSGADGRGSADTGGGTIGTGRYGKVGSGAGRSGGDGGDGRTSQVPTVSLGQPSAKGDLERAIIRRYIKHHIHKIEYCYEKELLKKPALAGTVQSEFVIAPDGKVASSIAKGFDDDVASCVAAVIEHIEFPKPKGGDAVQVHYPFIFHPPGKRE